MNTPNLWRTADEARAGANGVYAARCALFMRISEALDDELREIELAFFKRADELAAMKPGKRRKTLKRKDRP